MDDRTSREAALREQLFQLDREREGSALTPGEREKNEAQRRAVLAEIEGLGAEPGAPADR